MATKMVIFQGNMFSSRTKLVGYSKVHTSLVILQDCRMGNGVAGNELGNGGEFLK